VEESAVPVIIDHFFLPFTGILIKMKPCTIFKEDHMTAKKTVVYDCEVCGTEVTVNSEGMSNLSPIYCCGIAMSRRNNKSAKKPKEKIAAKKKTAAKQTGKKTTGKATVQMARKALR
jgi:Desulfoferrodoxin, N-terminal domain